MTALMNMVEPEWMGQIATHMWGDAYREPTINGIRAGVGAFMEGYYWHYDIPPHIGEVLDIPELEFAAIPCSFEVFSAAGVLPLPSMPISIHADGMAAVQDLAKHRVKNKAMRFIMEHFLAMTEVRKRMTRLTVSHDFGLRNPAGDAASRNEDARVESLCRSLGLHPVKLEVPQTVTQLFEKLASFIKQLQQSTRKRSRAARDNERHLGVERSSNDNGDGPHMHRSPKKVTHTKQGPELPTSKRSIAQGMRTPVSSPRQESRVTTPLSRSPKKVESLQLHDAPSPSYMPARLSKLASTDIPEDSKESTQIRRSPLKRPCPDRCQRTTGKPLKTAAQAKMSSYHKAKAAKVGASLLEAYPDDSPYRLRPPDLEQFDSLVADTEDYLLSGVPANVSANERSAMNKYWIPFCAAVGMSPDRPPITEQTPEQVKAEDRLKAICIPWIYVRMRGRNNPRPLPTSVMNVMYSINRQLNHDNDDDVKLKKPQRVLRGILTEYVAEYGPILPDQALPFPKQVLAALLHLPSGTRLGSVEFDRRERAHFNTLVMFETGVETGLRLDETSISRSGVWNKSKMSRASLVWRINGIHVTNPTPEQLRCLTEHDGACLSPATSKCDRWGNKHGHKTMFLPFRPSRTWNAARALRDMELRYPCPQAQRANEPLFTSAPGVAIPASVVRTLLYHMLRTQSVAAFFPSGADANSYSFHSFRKTFATSLGRAGASRERIQSMCRWLSSEAVDLYDKLDYDTHCKYVDAAYLHNAEVVTPAMLRTMRQTQIDDNDVLQTWCTHCHVDLSGQQELDWS